MKRLLACLFLVFGLGLVVNVNANALENVITFCKSKGTNSRYYHIFHSNVDDLQIILTKYRNNKYSWIDLTRCKWVITEQYDNELFKKAKKFVLPRYINSPEEVIRYWGSDSTSFKVIRKFWKNYDKKFNFNNSKFSFDGTFSDFISKFPVKSSKQIEIAKKKPTKKKQAAGTNNKLLIGEKITVTLCQKYSNKEELVKSGNWFVLEGDKSCKSNGFNNERNVSYKEYREYNKDRIFCFNKSKNDFASLRKKAEYYSFPSCSAFAENKSENNQWEEVVWSNTADDNINYFWSKETQIAKKEPTQTLQVADSGNLVNDLKELSKLYEEGLLTEEEFTKAKEKLLGTGKKQKVAKKEKKKEKKVAKKEPSPTQEVAKKKEGCIRGDCYDGQGTWIHPNGDKYVGKFWHGKPNGQGTYTSDSDGVKYVGEFKNASFHGQGTLTWADNGDKYVGEFKDNKYHKQGALTYASGAKYVGEFKNSKRHGYGTYTFVDGRFDEGIWVNGKLVKRNKIQTQIAKKEPTQTLQVAENNTVYFCDNRTTLNTLISYFISSTKNCKSSKRISEKDYILAVLDLNENTKKDKFLEIRVNNLITEYEAIGLNTQLINKLLISFDGNSLIAKKEPTQTLQVAKKQGCIEGNCKNGQGTYTWINGRKYVGEWKDNLKHGKGTFTWADGEKYVGEYKTGLRHGQGTYTMFDGSTYVGQWINDRRHGQGTLTFVDGSTYVGEWKDNERHGHGTSTWADGKKYVGEWKDNYYNGQGTLTKADGTIDNGIWNKWELVKRNKIQTQIAKKEPSQTQDKIDFTDEVIKEYSQKASGVCVITRMATYNEKKYLNKIIAFRPSQKADSPINNNKNDCENYYSGNNSIFSRTFIDKKKDRNLYIKIMNEFANDIRDTKTLKGEPMQVQVSKVFEVNKIPEILQIYQTQIAKKEPSQTQQVAKKIINIYCVNNNYSSIRMAKGEKPNCKNSEFKVVNADCIIFA